MSHGVAVALSRLSKDRERVDEVGSIVCSCLAHLGCNPVACVDVIQDVRKDVVGV